MRDFKLIPMPERIARRPRDPRGYPIPFVNLIRPDGSADLRVLDAERVELAVGGRLCAICGEPLTYWMVFIGGLECVTNRLFADPAMHEVCARYASKVCPYIATPGYHHMTDEAVKAKNPGAVIVANVLAPPGGSSRPDKMYLYFTRDFKLVKMGQRQLIQAGAPYKTEEILT